MNYKEQMQHYKATCELIIKDSKRELKFIDEEIIHAHNTVDFLLKKKKNWAKSLETHETNLEYAKKELQRIE